MDTSSDAPPAPSSAVSNVTDSFQSLTDTLKNANSSDAQVSDAVAKIIQAAKEAEEERRKCEEERKIYQEVIAEKRRQEQEEKEKHELALQTSLDKLKKTIEALYATKTTSFTKEQLENYQEQAKKQEDPHMIDTITDYLETKSSVLVASSRRSHADRVADFMKQKSEELKMAGTPLPKSQPGKLSYTSPSLASWKKS